MRSHELPHSGLCTVALLLAFAGIPAEGAAPPPMATSTPRPATPLPTPPPGTVPFLPRTPLQGWVDLHTHPLSNLGFAGKLFYGGIDASVDASGNPNGAMIWTDPDCKKRTWLQNNPQSIVRAGTEFDAIGHDGSTHGFNNLNCGDAIRVQVIHAFQRMNQASDPAGDSSGYPDFTQWPSWNDRTHQHMWVEWIRRAWASGLRVMVALALNNRTIADAVSGQGASSDIWPDDKASADLQVAETIAFVGRHSDFMQVAYSSADVDSIVRSNRIAVIVGAEIDHIGNFGTPNVPVPAEIGVRDEIDRLYSEGVRYLFPIHLLDNAFGGTATYSWMFNASTMRESGHSWSLVCHSLSQGEDPRDQITASLPLAPQGFIDILNSVLSDAGMAAAEQVRLGGVWIPPTAPPCNPNVGQRNTLGITPAGNVAINEMMRLGMLIDIDHMSSAAAEWTLAYAAGALGPTQALGLVPPSGYPVMSGHNGVRDATTPGPLCNLPPPLPNGTPGQPPCSTSERSLTANQYRIIANLHGMAGVGGAGLDAWQWVNLYNTIIATMGPGVAVGFGTDSNGLERGNPPRAVCAQQNPPCVRYADPPVCGFPGFPSCASLPPWTQPANTLRSPTDGTKAQPWNYNTDGVAHYGMLADFLMDIATLPAPSGGTLSGQQVVANLNQGAEYFYQTWRKAEALSSAVLTNWQPTGWLGWQQIVAGPGVTIPVKQIATSRNADGRLEIVYIAPNNTLNHTWQTTPEVAWTWTTVPVPLGGSPANKLAMGRNLDGRLQIFYTGPGNVILTNSQVTRGGAWSGEQPLGQGAALQIAVGQNADGRLEVFVVGTDNRLYHNAQLQPSGSAWSGWSPLNSSPASQLAVASNADGRLEVFYNGPNNTIYTNTQVSAGGNWTGETSMGGGALQFSVQQNKVGGLEVFIVGTDNAGWRNVQTGPNGPWGGWATFGGWLSQLATGRNSDGRLEVFCMGVNGALYHNVQTAPASASAPDGAWSGWQPLGGAAQQLVTGVNADGRLDVFVVGTDNLLYHNLQSP